MRTGQSLFIVALVTAYVALLSPVVAQETEEDAYVSETDGYLSEGYFVFVLRKTTESVDFYGEMTAMMEPCGIDAYNDWGWKYGMREYADVAAIGGYKNESDALEVLAAVQSCAPDAFVQRSRYAGE